MLDTKRQGRVPKEAAQEILTAREAAALAGDMGANLLDGVGRQIGETAVLEVAPQQFDGVELRRVGREPDDVPPAMVVQTGADEVMLVRAAAVPDQDDRAADVAGQMAQKVEHLGTADVHQRVQRQRERELPTGG